MKTSVGIIDCGINNINSLQKAFNKIEVKSEVVENHKKIQDFSHLVLPGVGSFDRGIGNLREMGFIEEIYNFVQKGNFILGICLACSYFLKKVKKA